MTVRWINALFFDVAPTCSGKVTDGPVLATFLLVRPHNLTVLNFGECN